MTIPSINSRYFINLTQPEIAAQLKKNPLVILPAGSVEQHGPHLPTGTDIYAANVISHAVAERMDGLVLPGGPLGVTPINVLSSKPAPRPPSMAPNG
jgi:creatinine amidohydrolase